MIMRDLAVEDEESDDVYPSKHSCNFFWEAVVCLLSGHLHGKKSVRTTFTIREVFLSGLLFM